METGGKFLSQKDFAARLGVQEGTVSKWKAKGLVVLNDAGQVDVEASEWKLDDRPGIYRGGVTHRPVRGVDQNKHDPRPPKKPAVRSVKRPSNNAPDPAAFDFDDPNLPHAEAVRRKENFLGLSRKHEYEVSRQEWVRVEDVGRSVERHYAVIRERLLAIPGKMASKLEGLDRTAIELALLEEITETLNELHAPDAGEEFDDAA